MPPRVPNTGEPQIDDDTEVQSGIDDILDEDADMYEDGDDNDEPDGGDDAGDSGSRSGDDGGDPTRQGAEPTLPMALPVGHAPQPAAYDPDNPKGFARVGSLFADKDGNIVTRDGRVMAAKGEPARHWSNLSKQAAQATTAERRAEALDRQIQSQKGLIEAAKELNDLPNRMGISREDYNTGVQLIAQWNRDPLTVARDIVQRTLARGFNASDILGKNAGDALEMGAIRRLIDEAVGPQRQREQVEQLTQRQRVQAQEAYDGFMSKYPDSAPHADAIAALMNNQKLSAAEAYHEVRYFAAQNGLDFSQPLGPQVAARQARAQQPVDAAPQGRTYRAPMVAGNGSGNRNNLNSDTQYASADSTWGDIINSVMRNS